MYGVCDPGSWNARLGHAQSAQSFGNGAGVASPNDMPGNLAMAAAAAAAYTTDYHYGDVTASAANASGFGFQEPPACPDDESSPQPPHPFPYSQHSQSQEMQPLQHAHFQHPQLLHQQQQQNTWLHQSPSPQLQPPPPPPLRRLGPQVTAEIDDRRLWEAFASVGTEMIITKSGRRMFPSLKLRLSGLEAEKRYCVYLTMEPVADCRWKFQSSHWQVVGKGEPAPAHRCFMHPDSPATGAHWLKQPVSFLRMKLTNNNMDPHGHIILNSMHKYRPRLYVAEIEESRWLPSRFVAYGSFDFPLAEFIAVTAYQNQRITQLKIDCNPFAKGFRVTGKRGSKKISHSAVVAAAAVAAVAAAASAANEGAAEKDATHREAGESGSLLAVVMKREATTDALWQGYYGNQPGMMSYAPAYYHWQPHLDQRKF